jgi:hypothetical protein
VNELRTELETELRALEVAPAPVAGTMRAGRRLRHRRRFAVAAGVLAVAAIAAGVPALTRAGAASAPLPATRPTGTPTMPDGDPVITDSPRPAGAPIGEIAQGTMGKGTWRVTIGRLGDTAASAYCVDVTGSAIPSPTGSPAAGCMPLETSAAPATFESFVVYGANEATVGSVATGVAYLGLTFTDGQRLTLIPVAVGGHRLVAFVTPVSMTIARVTAHLGTSGHAGGQSATTVPFSLPGELPVFGLWLSPGQTAPPRATRVIASGTMGDQPWRLIAYEGPWGTCFVPYPAITIACEQSLRLATTKVIGGWGGIADGWEPAYGSAAPGVASVAVTLDDGKTVTAVPVTVGNERLFAFLVGAGVSPTRWTAFSASGKVLSSGHV